MQPFDVLDFCPFERKDRLFVDELCQQNWKSSKQSVGYPRCEHVDELIAEVQGFENTMENCIYVVCLSDQLVAITGFLFTPSEREANLVGTIIDKKYFDYPLLNHIMQDLKQMAIGRFDCLSACIVNSTI